MSSVHHTILNCRQTVFVNLPKFCIQFWNIVPFFCAPVSFCSRSWIFFSFTMWHITVVCCPSFKYMKWVSLLYGEVLFVILCRNGPVQIHWFLDEEISVLLFVGCCTVECRVQLLQSLNRSWGQNLYIGLECVTHVTQGHGTKYALPLNQDVLSMQ